MATVVLVGKSASGKSTAAKSMEKAGYERIVTDTTRPIRDGEEDGVDYNFRTQEEFNRLKEEGYYAETSDYNASFGFCSYGSSKESYESDVNNVIVLNPHGLKAVKSVLQGSILSIYIDVPEDILVERLKLRGDSDAEIKRRMVHDKVDFADMPTFCDCTLSLTGSESEEDVLAKILEIVSTRKKVHVAFAVDDDLGLMFNNRRVSKDSKIVERLSGMALYMNGRVLCRPYSLSQFGDLAFASDSPWETARDVDIVFLEDVDPATVPNVAKVSVFRWGRKYPSDFKSTFDFSGYRLIETKEFPGTSHDKIVEETWKKN